MVKLKVKQHYSAADPSDSAHTLAYRRGDVVDVDDDLAAWLMRDAPVAFEEVKPEPAPRATKAPPKTRQTKAAPQDRATKAGKDDAE